MEKLYKRRIWSIRNKRGMIIQFVDSNNNKRLSIDDFAIYIPQYREQHKKNNGLWFQSEPSLDEYSLAEVTEDLWLIPNCCKIGKNR